MGLFDFLKKRKEKNLRRRVNEELRGQKRIHKLTRTIQERKVRKEEIRRVEYERINFWIESRIGLLTELNDMEVRTRLRDLLADERRKARAPRFYGDMDHRPYDGLEQYIRTNSYRRMLGSSGEVGEIVPYRPAEEESPLSVEPGEGGGGGTETTSRRPVPAHGTRERLDHLKSIDHSYGRIHYWLEERVGPMEGIDGEDLHRKLLDLLNEEKSAHPVLQNNDGKTYDPCAGLEAYIRSKAYSRMIQEAKNA